MKYTARLATEGFRARRERARRPEAILARIERHTVRTDGCWRWDGYHIDGYACLQVAGSNTYVHRLLWKLTHGPLPGGYELHHECRNRGCVNPDHLTVRSKAEHAHIHAQGRVYVLPTHCGKGHSWAEHGQWTGGRRRCLACRREWEQSRVGVSAH